MTKNIFNPKCINSKHLISLTNPLKLNYPNLYACYKSTLKIRDQPNQVILYYITHKSNQREKSLERRTK